MVLSVFVFKVVRCTHILLSITFCDIFSIARRAAIFTLPFLFLCSVISNSVCYPVKLFERVC